MKYKELTKIPVAQAEMFIRKPIAVVFDAFINPDITTRFWFTKSSGTLELGKKLVWTWEMYNLSVPVEVKEMEVNKRILITWGKPSETTSVEWMFTSYKSGTLVSITNSGFQGDADHIVSQALDSTGGFTWVLAGLKAYLEHNIELNLTANRYPKNLEEL